MPGPSTKGLLTSLFVYIFSRLAQAEKECKKSACEQSYVVLGPGFNVILCEIRIGKLKGLCRVIRKK